MAQPASTFSSYDAIGNREDLSDIIYNIAPVDTPFLNGIPKGEATASNHEWQTDTLAAASGTNAVIEGDDATTDAATASVRRGNHTQISDKVPRVTGTQNAVLKAGRDDEMSYQAAKRAKELKRDIETSLLANNAKVAGNDTTARELAGIVSWIATNESKDSGGTAPTGDGTDARVAGTARAFLESFLQTVLQAAWDAGGDPDCVMTGSFNKGQISTFTGNAIREVQAEHRTLHSSIDYYESEWGMLHVVPNRFQPADVALVLQKDMWKTAYLRPFQIKDLAKTGDTERKQLLVEYTLQASNEAASGIVADLTTS